MSLSKFISNTRQQLIFIDTYNKHTTTIVFSTKFSSTLVVTLLTKTMINIIT